VAKFKEVSNTVDFPALERDLLAWWDSGGIVEKYLHRNDQSQRRFSFLDGPITANNPMGVHHAWGRTYKDLFQRYHNMLGERQRFQNGFDCQGLWVEVEVEKEIGLKSKRDIETFGVAEFVQKCKDRVLKYSARQTDQSIRLGYFMDWDNSYFTMSDENNYTIWHFLKSCHQRGWIYKGHDSMPWCPRCGTGISQHEIVTEGYQDRTHLSVFVKLPLLDQVNAALLVWTTTPWTLPANVAAAVNPELTYLEIAQQGWTYYVAKEAASTALRGDFEIVREIKGSDLVDRPYGGPFDDLLAVSGVKHRVIAWEDVTAGEGTGIVHIAPGAGKEDFELSRRYDLPALAPLDEFGVYIDGYAWLSGQYVHDVAEPIVRDLKQRGVLYRGENYTHRYPVCWRCGTDLVFRLVDEWFINMDELRPQMMEITRQVNWVPGFGMDRELDWLAHMDDWMISKKRYWGLALPIYECGDCGTIEVIGSEDELKERAIEGWDEFEGRTPHRPFIDKVKIACAKCGQTVSRIPDVGNPWLDAGIVAFSTLNYRSDRDYWAEWYPADLITESFPGQFRNWFYSVLAMSTALTGELSFRNVFSYALMRDEHGEEMHKSKGNAIWFEDAAESMGVDTMRWLFSTVNPSQNLNFGFNVADEVRRRFILPLWNSYAFFANYARLDGFDPTDPATRIHVSERALLDRWVISRLNQVVATVRTALDAYQPEVAANEIERFVVEELSNWYIRRNRRRFWKSESDADKVAAYLTLYECLSTVVRLLAPFIPFVSEAIYQNLVCSVDKHAPESVHLTDFPMVDESAIDEDLSRQMEAVIEAVRLGRAARSAASVKVRQPLPAVLIYTRDRADFDAIERLSEQVLEELNVKEIRPLTDVGEVVSYSIRPNLPVLGPKYGKQLGAIRQALAAADAGMVAGLVDADRSVELTLPNGDALWLDPSEILVDLNKRDGYAAAQGPGMTVALDTELTPVLIREGWVRDFIRGVQDARKSTGLQIEDRIDLRFNAKPEVTEAILASVAYVKAETLARTVEAAEDCSGSTIEVGDDVALVQVSRAG
jgi:isoleucyl-tRNA synthetase